MATEWAFLEPWRSVLCDGSISENTHAGSVLNVTFKYIDSYLSGRARIYLRISRNRPRQQAAISVQQLREAIELFTLLSLVNNDAFIDLVESSGIQIIGPGGADYYPKWTFQLVGDLSTNNSVVTQTPASWGTLLGCPDDPWDYSPEFRAAAQKLEAMGVEESSKRRVQRRSAAIDWTSSSNVDVGGNQKSDQFVDPSRLFCGRLFRQFDTMVPPIAQLCASWGGPTPADFWLSPRSASATCEAVRAQIWQWTRPAIPELTMALARTSTSDLELSLSNNHGDDSLQEVMNAGILLTTLVCGRPMYAVSDRSSNSFHDTIRLKYGRVKCLSSWTRGRLFTAICSAVAGVSAEAHLACLEVFFEGSEQWSWLVCALCCGSSTALLPAVNLWQARVTKSDIEAISAVLQTHYPQPILNSNGKGSHAYGFVDIRAGTKLYPVLDGDNGSGIVLSSGCRCRALYDPKDSVSWVDCVVPGYGICKAKLGEGVKFTPDTGKPVFPEKRLCGSLTIYNITPETPAVLMELLTLVASGLRSLTMYIDEEAAAAGAIRIDLSALSMACPELQRLCIPGPNVVVSGHGESLRRMKFPAKSKAAMLSVVTSASCATKPIHRLGEDILSLIFAFASTPQQHLLVCR